LRLADNYKLLVIPVRIEDVKPSGGDFELELGWRQWLDAFGDQQQEIENVAERVNQIVLRHKEPREDLNPVIKKEVPEPKISAGFEPMEELKINRGELQIKFLKEIIKGVDLPSLPFKLENVPTEKDIEKNKWWVEWKINNTPYSFSLWFDRQYLQKIKLYWGFSTQNEGDDPSFSKICEEINKIPRLLDKGGNVSINDNIYIQDKSGNSPVFATFNWVDFSELNKPSKAIEIGALIISLSQNLWPVIQKNLSKADHL